MLQPASEPDLTADANKAPSDRRYRIAANSTSTSTGVSPSLDLFDLRLSLKRTGHSTAVSTLSEASHAFDRHKLLVHSNDDLRVAPNDHAMSVLIVPGYAITSYYQFKENKQLKCDDDIGYGYTDKTIRLHYNVCSASD